MTKVKVLLLLSSGHHIRLVFDGVNLNALKGWFGGLGVISPFEQERLAAEKRKLEKDEEARRIVDTSPRGI